MRAAIRYAVTHAAKANPGDFEARVAEIDEVHEKISVTEFVARAARPWLRSRMRD